ncbi:hypothetical protein QTP88_028086 [Uroleucon formosanum]
MFDEMSLQPELTYDKHVDGVFGFEDLGSNQRNFKLADHVLVFMVRGLGKKFKQPICYYYVQGTTKTFDLVQCIHQVVQSILTTGLNLVATLSDQGKTNVATINILKRETSISFLKQGLDNCIKGYIIDGHEVVHIYDPPHLLNNEDMGYRALPKLTEEHVVIEKLRKMKVSTSTQTLSHPPSNPDIGNNALGTAAFCLFMDQCFDSENAATRNAMDGKILRSAVTSSSSHITFWNTAIEVFKSMRFVHLNKQTNITKVSTPLCVKNWIVTLRGFKYVWPKL